MRDVVAKAVEPFQNASAGEQCSRYMLNRELIEQRSDNISLLAKLRGTERLNEFTLRGKVSMVRRNFYSQRATLEIIDLVHFVNQQLENISVINHYQGSWLFRFEY